MNAAAIYKRTQAETADPDRIMILLFEGALARIRQGVSELDGGDRRAGTDSLDKACEIVLQLRSSLDHERAPELCEQLSDLYVFASTRLSQSITSGDPKFAQEAERALAPIADAFSQAVASLRTGG